MTKSQARENFKKRLLELSQAEKDLESDLIAAKLATQILLPKTVKPCIFMYSPLPDEPAIAVLVSRFPDLCFCFPRVLPERKMSYHPVAGLHQLVPGSFGILEPLPQITAEVVPSEADLMIVPGLAFSLSGARLGHGRGYYDRYLRGLIHRPTLVGVAFSPCIVTTAQWPIESHDFPMNHVVTGSATL